MSISTLQQSESVIHVHTSIPSFMDFLPFSVTTEHWVEFPMPYSRFSLVIYFTHSSIHMDPGGSAVKKPPANVETWVWSLGGEDPWRRKQQPTTVFLPEKSQGQRSLVDYSPWGHKKSDMTTASRFSNSSHPAPSPLLSIWNILHATPSCFSHVQLYATLWTAAHQAPLSTGFSR